MLNIVKQYTPNTWDSYSKTSTLESDTEEYRELRNEVNAMMSTLEIKEILRVQDLQAYGQFLIREQLLLKTETSPLYRVRYYVMVNNAYRDKVVKYNLDPRRCGMALSTLSFNKKLDYCEPGRSVVVVKVLTTEPDKKTICPKTSC
ncbi:unnamed protein product, partial [Tenebrio molitor]